jgi:RecA-family ATPase
MRTEEGRYYWDADPPADAEAAGQREFAPIDEDLAAVTAEATGLQLIDLAAWATMEASPKAFALTGYIPEREVTLLSGVGGSNKSGFGQQLSTCFAAGIPMLGVPTAGGGASLYLTAEDDERELHWRHVHIVQALRVDTPSLLVGRLHMTSIRGELENQLASFGVDGRMLLTSAFQNLRRSIAAERPKLVVLDNVAHLFAGNENDRVQVTQFVNALYSLCNEFGCAIVLIAHPNKSGDDYSGSTAWLNAVRSHIVIRRPEGHPDPDVRELTLSKANYARVGETVPFRWHDFALILETDLPEDIRADLAATARASADNELFLRCLDLRNAQERPVSDSPASRTYAPKEFDEMAESSRIGRARLIAAQDRLFRVGAIEVGLVCRSGRKDRFGLRRKCADLRADPAPTVAPTCAD